MRHKIFVAGILLLFFAVISCEKSTYESVTNFKVRLASTQYDAEQLNVNITEVKVMYSGNSAWVPLNTPGQVYNLLEFQAGVDTLIAEGDLPATSIVEQLKFIIGPGNSIKLGGKTQPLSTVNTDAELTLVINKKLNRKIETINLVFDPSLSVSQSTDGSYQLNPVVSLQK